MSYLRFCCFPFLVDPVSPSFFSPVSLDSLSCWECGYSSLMAKSFCGHWSESKRVALPKMMPLPWHCWSPMHGVHGALRTDSLTWICNNSGRPFQLQSSSWDQLRPPWGCIPANFISCPVLHPCFFVSLCPYVPVSLCPCIQHLPIVAFMCLEHTLQLTPCKWISIQSMSPENSKKMVKSGPKPCPRTLSLQCILIYKLFEDRALLVWEIPYISSRKVCMEWSKCSQIWDLLSKISQSAWIFLPFCIPSEIITFHLYWALWTFHVPNVFWSTHEEGWVQTPFT